MPPFRYECLPVVQQESAGAPSFCIFHAPVADVLAWSDIRRLEDEPGAPQRRMSPAKVKAIRRFLEQDKRNTIPTSVILTLDLPAGSVVKVDGYESFSVLTFEVQEGQQKPGLVIDGQHRLYAYSGHPRARRSMTTGSRFLSKFTQKTPQGCWALYGRSCLTSLMWTVVAASNPNSAGS